MDQDGRQPLKGRDVAIMSDNESAEIPFALSEPKMLPDCGCFSSLPTEPWKPRNMVRLMPKEQSLDERTESPRPALEG